MSTKHNSSVYSDIKHTIYALDQNHIQIQRIKTVLNEMSWSVREAKKDQTEDSLKQLTNRFHSHMNTIKEIKNEMKHHNLIGEHASNIRLFLEHDLSDLIEIPAIPFDFSYLLMNKLCLRNKKNIDLANDEVKRAYFHLENTLNIYRLYRSLLETVKDFEEKKANLSKSRKAAYKFHKASTHHFDAHNSIDIQLALAAAESLETIVTLMEKEVKNSATSNSEYQISEARSLTHRFIALIRAIITHSLAIEIPIADNLKDTKAQKRYLQTLACFQIELADAKHKLQTKINNADSPIASDLPTGLEPKAKITPKNIFPFLSFNIANETDSSSQNQLALFSEKIR